MLKLGRTHRDARELSGLGFVQFKPTSVVALELVEKLGSWTKSRWLIDSWCHACQFWDDDDDDEEEEDDDDDDGDDDDEEEEDDDDDDDGDGDDDDDDDEVGGENAEDTEYWILMVILLNIDRICQYFCTQMIFRDANDIKWQFILFYGFCTFVWMLIYPTKGNTRLTLTYSARSQR